MATFFWDLAHQKWNCTPNDANGLQVRLSAPKMQWFRFISPMSPRKSSQWLWIFCRPVNLGPDGVDLPKKTSITGSSTRDLSRQNVSIRPSCTQICYSKQWPNFKANGTTWPGWCLTDKPNHPFQNIGWRQKEHLWLKLHCKNTQRYRYWKVKKSHFQKTTIQYNSHDITWFMILELHVCFVMVPEQ